MFALTIETDNEAFGRDPSNEVRRILLELCNRIEPCPSGSGEGRLRDSNGNTVGRWELTDSEESTAELLDPEGSGYVAEPPWNDEPTPSGAAARLREDLADLHELSRPGKRWTGGSAERLAWLAGNITRLTDETAVERDNEAARILERLRRRDTADD